MLKTMNLISEIKASAEEFSAIRQRIHQHPELGFEESETASLVAELLTEWGYEVHTGIGGTGVVGVLKSGAGERAIGIRADMDALPILEDQGLSYRSRHEGKMHACGHDGHTATLLCAARHLARTRAFSGTLNLIFQPAEETLGGAVAMMEDGLFERFPCDAVYAQHNAPGLPVGHFLVQQGSLGAASDSCTIRLIGCGGHGAMPHLTKDPVVAASELVLALQSIVARNVASGEIAVVTVGSLVAGDAPNVVPELATLKLSIRTTSPDVQDLLERRIKQVAQGVADAHDMTLEFTYKRQVPRIVNTESETALAREVLTELVGAERVLTTGPKGGLGSEDFAWMLQRKPGCYVALGNGHEGHGSCAVHNPGYDFNDAAIPVGASYWARLVEAYLV